MRIADSGRTTVAVAALGLSTLGSGAGGAANAAPVLPVRELAVAGSDTSVSSTHAFTTLHFFQDDGARGLFPRGNLDLAITLKYGRLETSLYGVTAVGGAQREGIVFEQHLQSGAFEVRHSFRGSDGAYPESGLANNIDDAFIAGSPQIGTTTSGGAYNQGTLYVMSANGTVNVVHSFANGADGRRPMSRITAFVDGNFYGTADWG